MANVQSGYHSLFFSVCPRTKEEHTLCLSEDKQHTVLKLGIFCVEEEEEEEEEILQTAKESKTSKRRAG